MNEHCAILRQFACVDWVCSFAFVSLCCFVVLLMMWRQLYWNLYYSRCLICEFFVLFMKLPNFKNGKFSYAYSRLRGMNWRIQSFKWTRVGELMPTMTGQLCLSWPEIKAKRYHMKNLFVMIVGENTGVKNDTTEQRTVRIKNLKQ